MRAFGVVDIVIISALIFAAIAAFPALMFGQPGAVVVFRQNAVVAQYPADADTVFTINGKNGPLDIRIKDGAVKIVHANCPRGICIRAGAVSGPHAQLICAPNNILIRMRHSKSDVDGVTY